MMEIIQLEQLTKEYDKKTVLNGISKSICKEYGAMDGLKLKETEQQIGEMGCDFFMDGLLDSSMKSMSKGTLQKVD